MQDQIIESLENPLLNHSYSLRVEPLSSNEDSNQNGLNLEQFTNN
jgi:hypothetical protein